MNRDQCSIPGTGMLFCLMRSWLWGRFLRGWAPWWLVVVTTAELLALWSILSSQGESAVSLLEMQLTPLISTCSQRTAQDVGPLRHSWMCISALYLHYSKFTWAWPLAASQPRRRLQPDNYEKKNRTKSGALAQILISKWDRVVRLVL